MYVEVIIAATFGHPDSSGTVGDIRGLCFFRGGPEIVGVSRVNDECLQTLETFLRSVWKLTFLKWRLTCEYIFDPIQTGGGADSAHADFGRL